MMTTRGWRQRRAALAPKLIPMNKRQTGAKGGGD